MAGIPSEKAVRTATERGWDDWFGWLDAAGAASSDHKSIVALLKPEVESSWWQQSIAVAYEKSRGLRQAHQKGSSYEISRSRTFDASADRVFEAFTGDRAWLGDFEMDLRTAQPGRTLRFGRSDRTTVQVYLTPKTSERCGVTVMQGGLPDPEAAEAAKAFWAQALVKLGRALAGP